MVAAFTDPEARAVLGALPTGASTWRNAFAARAILALLRYRPGALADRVSMPLLVCIAEHDTAGSVALAIRAAGRAPRGALRRYPVGHFAVYVGEVRDWLIADEAAFLCTHLLVVSPPPERGALVPGGTGILNWGS